MSTSKPPHTPAIEVPATFCTTRRSVVLSAQGKSAGDARQSLEALCNQYWTPLYVYVRHRGHAEHDAQDLTQAFFARFLEKDWLATARRERGRFRTFLLMALKRFLANEWDHSQAQKRGGAMKIVNMDTAASISIPDRGQVSAVAIFER